MNWDRPSKNECREYIAKFPGRIAKSVLMLPGTGALCVKEGIKSGLIDTSTDCLFVERDKHTYSQMVVAVNGLNINQDCRCCNLHEISDNRLYDFVFLDFNGPITIQTAAWCLDYLSPRLMPRCDIAVTLHGTYRNCPFAKASLAFFRSYPSYTVELSRIFAMPDIIQIAYLASLLHLFYPHRFGVTPIKYKDTHKMYTFLMSSISGDPGYTVPLYDQFMNLVLERRHVMANKVVDKRKQAALKAWETRRAQAEFAKRSAAAHKAWETRRATA